MEHKQARILLQKINRLFDAIASSDAPPSRIEVDLLHDYTRQFYDSLSAAASAEPEPEKPATVEIEKPVFPIERVAEPDRVKQEVIREQVPSPAAIANERSSALNNEPVPEEVAPEAQPVETPPPSKGPTTFRADYDVLFMTEEAKDLSDKLRTSPIDDLSRAMGINERFLTINELFHGNHEAFDQVLRRLNDLSCFDDARRYLEDEVISRYDWLDKTRAKKAGIFIRLVRRRYL